MTNFLRHLVKDERGQDTIDCALLIGVVALVGIAVFSGSGVSLRGMGASAMEQLSAMNTSAG